MSTVEESPSNLAHPSVDRSGAQASSGGQAEHFLDLSLCGIALASVSADGRPIVGKGAGCVVGDGVHRITARKPFNEKLIEAVMRGAPVAATFSQPTTHKSIQFKARTGRLDDPTSQDYAAAERQRERFSAELVASAYSAEFTDRYTAFAPHELVVIEIRSDNAFDQTPGPGAGARLR